MSTLLSATAFLAPPVCAEVIKVITSEAELRKVTDTYRSDLSRPRDFIPQGDGTVIDKRTGLQWMRCSLGQKWTGKTCEGKPSQYTWSDANKQKRDFAGYNDWRLPNRFELGTLVYCEKRKNEPNKATLDKTESLCKGNYKQPTTIQQIFPQTQMAYWSSSDDFGNDITDSATKNTKMFVRLVRDPK